MQTYKTVLSKSVQVVVFLFAAFGGVLAKIAPPDQVNSVYPVGIVSFFALIILLIITAYGRSADPATAQKRWLAVGSVAFILALPAAYVYRAELKDHTYTYPKMHPTVTRVSASEKDLQSPAPREWVKTHPYDAKDLNANFEYEQIWTQESISHYEMLLLSMYAALVLALATAVFAFIEALSGGPHRTATTGTAPKRG